MYIGVCVYIHNIKVYIYIYIYIHIGIHLFTGIKTKRSNIGLNVSDIIIVFGLLKIDKREITTRNDF